MSALSRARWGVTRRARRIGTDELRLRRSGAFTAAAAKRNVRASRVGAEPHGLINDLAAFIRRFVVVTPEQLLVVALWVVHTHCVERFAQTPYLAVTSPEKQCGKSRLLEVLDLLVPRPWMTVTPSEAVVFRYIDKRMPTLLLDEVDTIFNPRTADKYEGLRSLLNSGHRRGARVSRCVGATGNIAEFSVFSAKVLAGIGTLPDTVADRSVPIRLERRKPDEEVERFRHRDIAPDAHELLLRMHAWVAEHADALEVARPDLPDELSDRMQDGCECLIAIADAAGCGAAARTALVTLLTGERLDDQETMRLRLLRDLRTVFARRKMPNGITTSTLLAALVAMDESPWSNYYGRSLEDRDLANLLKPYGIRSTTFRPKKRAGANAASVRPQRGYKRDALYEAWERYL